MRVTNNAGHQPGDSGSIMVSKILLVLMAIALSTVIRRWWQRQQASLNAGMGIDRASMSRQQALDVLGLASNATRDDIIDAHRRLIQKLHPDRGGSDYLAAQINHARQILLDKVR